MAGAAGPVGGAVVGGAISYGLQKDSQKFQRDVLQNQKQWLVADLRAAGLNPILAAGGLGGQVSGGGGIASPTSAGDLGEGFRKGGLFKAAKAKLEAEKVTAMWDAKTAEHLSTQQSDQAIIKQMERVQATASHSNRMDEIRSRREFYKAGVEGPGGFKLEGSDVRKWGIFINQLFGREKSSAKE